MQTSWLSGFDANTTGCADQTLFLAWGYNAHSHTHLMNLGWLTTVAGAVPEDRDAPSTASRWAAQKSDCESRPKCSEAFADLSPTNALEEPTPGLSRIVYRPKSVQWLDEAAAARHT